MQLNLTFYEHRFCPLVIVCVCVQEKRSNFPVHGMNKLLPLPDGEWKAFKRRRKKLKMEFD